MYILAFATRAKKDLRKQKRSGNFPAEKFWIAMGYLERGQALPISYRDHCLQGSLSIYREFHLATDLLVQYKRNNEKHIITIAAIGSHVDLFGE